MLRINWHLGFTAFGSPPVHFQIFHRKFVEKEKWIDEQLYQEIFGLCQALPGPASTKMLYCINCIHGGFLSGLLAFFIWSLPGAFGMYGLSLGVSRVGESLPSPVYALLSGLNAATVGIIALAAVQLSEKAITDKMTRILVFLGGVAGMLYTALWYYPVLMAMAGAVTVAWDGRWPHRLTRFIVARGQPNEHSEQAAIYPEQSISVERPTETNGQAPDEPVYLRHAANVGRQQPPSTAQADQTDTSSTNPQNIRNVPQSLQFRLLTWKVGVCIICSFLVTFIITLLVRALVDTRPLGISLFANLYLAGTIIFGGGPVVIPLLREYIVAEGWVSSRDFLLGLAIIQAFPGPNFNFTVYLGALTAAKSSLPSFAGALIGFIGIFTPGLVIFTGVMGFWSVLRSKRWLLALLRGVNAGAVGLVFTAVYKLWQIGYVDGETGMAGPLGSDPWWVAITAGSFVGGKWFGVNAPVAIICGGILGLVWYGVVKT